MRIAPRWLCRCGLRFHSRKDLRAHVKRVHLPTGPAKTRRGLNGKGLRELLPAPKLDS